MLASAVLQEEKWKAVSQEYKGWKRYYLFPLESLRDMDLFPTPNPKKGKYYKTGMYIPYGGVSWTRFFNETMVYPKQLKHLSDAEYTKYDRMVTTIVMHLIQGVSLLHQMNIVHNDIWAENLLVDSSYCVRLIDWVTYSLVRIKIEQKLIQFFCLQCVCIGKCNV